MRSFRIVRAFRERRLCPVSLVTVAVCLGLAVLLLELQEDARRAGFERRCFNNLHCIGLALHYYHKVYHSIPPASTCDANGTPLHSWRALIAPFLVQNALHEQYHLDDAWNGPANRRLTDEVPDDFGGKYGTMLCDADYFFYRCPSALPSQNRMCTNYVMLIDDRPGKANGPPHLPGSVPPGHKPHSAVIVIEIADSDIHWMEPRDVLLSELSMKINDRSTRSLSSYHGGACILHEDGQVEILDEAVTEERLRDLLTQ